MKAEVAVAGAVVVEEVYLRTRYKTKKGRVVLNLHHQPNLCT